MAKKIMKPSKRGKKAEKVSLHCAPEIVTSEKKIQNWTKLIKSIVAFVKTLLLLYREIKPLIEWCKSFFE